MNGMNRWEIPELNASGWCHGCPIEYVKQLKSKREKSPYANLSDNITAQKINDAAARAAKISIAEGNSRSGTVIRKGRG